MSPHIRGFRRRFGRRETSGLLIFMLISTLTLLLSGCSTSGYAGATHAGKAATPTPTSTPAPPPLANAARIDAYLTGLEERGELSGAVLVAQNGQVFAKGYGLADKDARIPNTPQTMFRLGSVTKQFTAMAILQLQDEGKLHVRDHICLYISACPQDWQPITIEQLLTHTSGIPNYTNFPGFVATWTQHTTPEELISRFKDLPLEFPPGSLFRYSNSGYVLLGSIIERVSGESYAAFLQQHIFAPLRMYESGYDSTYPQLPQHATGYYAGYVKPEPYDMSVVYAAGALYSSVGDLYIWDQALTAHRLVSEQSLDAMFTVHIPCPPPGRGGCLLSTDLGYGYGWFIAAEPQGRLIYHVGHIDGYFAYNGFYAGRDLYVVVLSNLETTDVLKIGRTLAAMV
jgi:CubicO group peptidase (beta-lactamase class C family)